MVLSGRQKFILAAATFVAASGLLVLLGWLVDNTLLEGVIAGTIPMNPATAVTFIATAVAIGLKGGLHRDVRTARVAAFLAALIATMGVVQLARFLTPWDVALDRVLFRGRLADSRMAPNTAFCFALVGLSLLTIDARRVALRTVGQAAAICVAITSSMSLIGYLCGADGLYAVGPHTPMAINTAVCLLACSLGLLSIEFDRSAFAVLAARDAGGTIARRLLPAAIAIPIALGFLRVLGQRAGYFDTEFGAAIMVVVTVVALVGAIATTAAALGKADTERQRAEATIHLYADIVRHIPIGMTIWRLEDPQDPRSLRLVSTNPAAATLLGIATEPLIGRTLIESFPAVSDEDLATFAEVARDGQCREIPERLYGDERVAPKMWATKAFPLPDGCVGLAFEDITERKQAEEAIHQLNSELEQRVELRTAELRQRDEQLRQAQKMEAIGQLAGGIAHDFNNLLTIIIGYSDVLTDSDDVPPVQRKEMLREIHKAAERAALLTRQLLAFSRKQILEPRIINLNDSVREIEKMLRRLIGEHIRVHTNLATSLEHISADPGQIEQVIMNLAVNARDAMPQGGELSIETANVELDTWYARGHAEVKPGRYVMLALSDNGCGMNEQTKARIFEPFFTTKEPGKGTGLGLATAYGIVTQSGGHICVYSEPGRGTTFKIYFPVVAQPDSEGPSSRRPQYALRGDETILLVEDDSAVRSLTRSVLEMYGYTVLEANGPDEAIRICESHEGGIDALLSDIVMPQMNGKCLSDVLRPKRPEMKILFMSGYTDDALVRQGILEPGIGFIQKPFTAQALSAKLRGAFDPARHALGRNQPPAGGKLTVPGTRVHL